jgi:hypothetical protein
MKKFGSLIFLLILAACASGNDEAPPKDEPPPEPEIRTEHLICPQVAILRQAEEVFDYAGEPPAADQLVAKAKLDKIEGDCAYRKDDDNSGIDIAFTLHGVAARGPRLGGEKVSFPYFIAVVDPADKVVSREVVTAHYNFGEGKVAEISEPLHVFIPMPVAQLGSGPAYRVLIGLIKK